MAEILTANEEAQLLQTIEMFEVITQSQPHDYQSLEILKEAYSKLGRQQDVITTSKRIAEAYVQLGQLSSAILEYESVLQQFPGDPDVQKALAEIENRASSFSSPMPQSDTDLLEKQILDEGAKAPAKAAPGDAVARVAGELEDGMQAMRRIFVDGKLISANDFERLWPQPSLNGRLEQPRDPFLQILADKSILPIEQSLRALSDKSRLSYLPIEKYDVDVELARSFPREICYRWTVLPFDKMSKSVMVATCNPFNKQAARELEECTQNRLLWYLTSPAELVKVIKKIIR